MSAGTTTIAYVGNADSQDISVVELKPDGSLVLLETTRVPGPSTPGPSLPLAISPDRQRLIAGIRGEPFAAVTFDIDQQTGRLTLVGSGPLFDSMAYLSIDGTGRYLLGASYGGSRVAVNQIGTDGIVAPAQQVIATAPKAHAIIVDPTNSFVLHTSLGGDLIHQQRFDALTGRLTPNTPPTAPIAAGSGPRHLVFSPDARFVYVLGELDASIHVLPWDAASGTLGEAVQIASGRSAGFGGEPWAADIHVTPDGRFLYATERASHTIAAFRIDPANGKLIPLGSTPTETQPRGFTIDPRSRYLLAVGQLSDRMSSYAIDQTAGTLTRVAELPVGRNPNWVEIVALS